MAGVVLKYWYKIWVF